MNKIVFVFFFFCKVLVPGRPFFVKYWFLLHFRLEKKSVSVIHVSLVFSMQKSRVSVWFCLFFYRLFSLVCGK